VYVVAWIRHDPSTLREVLRIEALSRPELSFGVAQRPDHARAGAGDHRLPCR
jgi:hypothetical protein